MAKSKLLICPYCGDTQSAGERCRACGGYFEPLSRQASHNAMGPWFIRDPKRPFQPGASYETIVSLIDRGVIDKHTILRGPTTRQFWTIAKRVPGAAHLLGYCHNCDASVDPGDHGCHACGATFGAYLDRNFMGLPDVRPLPWEADSDERESGFQLGPHIEVPEDEAERAQAGRPSHGRISSFVSDAQLRGDAPTHRGRFGTEGRPAEALDPEAADAKRDETVGDARAGDSSETSRAKPTGAAVTVSPTTSTATQSAPHAAVETLQPAEQAEPESGSTAIRRLQQRIHQQRRTIRRLLFGLVISTLLCAALLVLFIQARASAISPAAGAEDVAAERTDDPGIIDPDATGSAAQENSGEESSAVGGGDQRRPNRAGQPASADEDGDGGESSSGSDDASSTGAADGGGEATSGGASEPIEQRWRDAQQLIESAEDEDRSQADRLADYDRALALLESIRQHAAEDQWPTGLVERIEQVRRDRERLELREFFGDE